MAAAIFALAGTLLGVLGTLAVNLSQSRREDTRARRNAVRLACADFTAAITRMRTLAMELRNKHPSGEQMKLMHEAHREARVHYERLRLTASSPAVQGAGRLVLRYAYGLLRQMEGKSLRDDEKASGPLRLLHDSLMTLYAEARRELGVPRAHEIYREPDEWVGEIDPDAWSTPTS
jgi:hypothetical protein